MGVLARLFARKPARTYDKENQIPVIRSSICTGEQTAGFKNKRTGVFQPVCLIRTKADLRAFVREYALNEADITREY